MGNDIPHVGLGVYRIPASRTAEAVRAPLAAGCRHIDTAQVCGNEAEVGTAIRESGLPREDCSPRARAVRSGFPISPSPIRRGWPSGRAPCRTSTPAQLILRWHVQPGTVPLPKSVTPARIRENIAVFDFRIEAGDMDRIAALDGDPHGARSRTRDAGPPRWQ